MWFSLRLQLLSVALAAVAIAVVHGGAGGGGCSRSGHGGGCDASILQNDNGFDVLSDEGQSALEEAERDLVDDPEPYRLKTLFDAKSNKYGVPLLCRIGNDLVAELGQTSHALVFFYASWCSHCKRTFPHFVAAARHIHDKVSRNTKFCIVDASGEFNRTVSSRSTTEGADDVPATGDDAHLPTLRGGDAVASQFGVHTFPSMLVFHYGKHFKDVRNVGRTKASIIKAMNQLLLPPSVEIHSPSRADEVLETATLERSPAAFGCFQKESASDIAAAASIEQENVRTLAESQFASIGEAFRGSVYFYHTASAEVCHHLNLSQFEFRIHKNHPLVGQSFLDPLKAPTAAAIKRPKKGSWDWRNAEGGSAATATGAGTTATRGAQGVKVTTGEAVKTWATATTPPGSGPIATPQPTAAAAASHATWYDEPTVSSSSWLREGSVAENETLGTPIFAHSRFIELTARHAVPPIDVLNAHNRPHYNLRSGITVFVFHVDVERDVVSAMERQSAGAIPIGTLAQERSFLLTRIPDLRYVTRRLIQSVLPKFGGSTVTVLFADYTENKQIFEHFDFDRASYGNRRKLQFGVIHGTEKFRYVQEGRMVPPEEKNTLKAIHDGPAASQPDGGGMQAPAVFDVAGFAAFLEDVHAGRAQPYVRSSKPSVDPDAQIPGNPKEIVRATYNDTLRAYPHAARFVLFVTDDHISFLAAESFTVLSRAEEGNTGAAFYIFDTNSNDIPDEIEVEKLPLLVAYGAQPATSHLAAPSSYYDGDYSPQSMGAFAIRSSGEGVTMRHTVKRLADIARALKNQQGGGSTRTDVDSEDEEPTDTIHDKKHTRPDGAADDALLDGARREGQATGTNKVQMRRAGKDAKGNTVYLPVKDDE